MNHIHFVPIPTNTTSFYYTIHYKAQSQARQLHKGCKHTCWAVLQKATQAQHIILCEHHVVPQNAVDNLRKLTSSLASNDFAQQQQ